MSGEPARDSIPIMRRLQPYALLLVFAALGFATGGFIGLILGVAVWVGWDQIQRRRAGTWSTRKYPWQRLR